MKKLNFAAPSPKIKLILTRTALIFSHLLIAAHSHAADIIDVYGVNETTAQRIISRYSKQIRAIETPLMQKLSTGTFNEHDHSLLQKKQRLIQIIMRNEHVAFVDFQTIAYPNNPHIYTTIEVINSNEPERLRFIEPKTVNHFSPSPNDIIHQMQTYIQLTFNLIMAGKEPAIIKTCPVYHCLSGFQHPQLRPYLALFNQAALHQKSFIMHTLQFDKDVERRAAAVFLLGHLANPQEIITTLLPYLTDSSAQVRNNVIRVIGATLLKAPVITLDIQPFVALLSSPYVTDRNKALFVLLTMADISNNQQYLLKHCRKILVALLELKQPNNHDLAYQLLKKISGQNFGESNFVAWEQWANTDGK